MPSTSLEMHQNRFRPGLRTGPHWRSLQRSLRPLAGGEGARRVLPKNPTPSSALRASAIQAMLCRPLTPPKINPSYGLVCVCSSRITAARTSGLVDCCLFFQRFRLQHSIGTLSFAVICKRFAKSTTEGAASIVRVATDHTHTHA